MLVILSAGLLIIIFVLIAGLHFYWAVGGRWGIHSAVPTNEHGKRMLETGPVACIVVTLGLLSFATYYAVQTGWIGFVLPGFLNFLGWVIPSIFLLRAIGDFKYVGLTRKLKGTTFARQDALYFTPLCLTIAALGFLIQVS
jgi:hypothetical protein